MDKIYSRRRIHLPKIVSYKYKNNMNNSKYTLKMIKIIIIITIALITVYTILKSITPIMDKNCMNIAKSIATKVSNEQATLVMSKYKYENLFNIEKDTNGNITMISTNIVAINEIISDITIKIQEELDKTENSKFNIRLGSFTGSKLFSGRGPNIEIKMSTIGNLDTDLRSELIASGINQTLHRIYLQVECNVAVLTPFDTIEEKIVNQVLLSEAVIVGITPNTYYNLEGISQDTTLEVIE